MGSISRFQLSPNCFLNLRGADVCTPLVSLKLLFQDSLLFFKLFAAVIGRAIFDLAPVILKPFGVQRPTTASAMFYIHAI